MELEGDSETSGQRSVADVDQRHQRFGRLTLSMSPADRPRGAYRSYQLRFTDSGSGSIPARSATASKCFPTEAEVHFVAPPAEDSRFPRRAR